MSTSKAASTAAPQTEVKPVAPADLPSITSSKSAVSSTASPAVNAGTKRATKTAAKAPQKVKVSTSPVKPSSSTKAVSQTPASAKSAPKAGPKAAPKAATQAAPKASPKPASQPNTKVTTRQTVATEKVKAVKEKKVKVVRDSFTIPKTEFDQLSVMKKRATALGVDIKKSEVIRAGLQLLSGLADAAFTKALTSVPTIKTGRPSKD
jgi:hypothetical protein